MGYLKIFWKAMKEAKVIEGLDLELCLWDIVGVRPHVGGVWAVTRDYLEMKNYLIRLEYSDGRIEYMKRDGEKERFLIEYF